MAVTKRFVPRRLLDIALLVFLLAVFFTGESGTREHDGQLHQLLALVFGAGVSLHLVWQWKWIICISKRFFGKLKGKVRLDYVIAIFLVVTFLVTFGTGLAISSWVTDAPDSGLVHLHHVMPKLFLLGGIFHTLRHWRYLVGARAPQQRHCSPPNKGYPRP